MIFCLVLYLVLSLNLQVSCTSSKKIPIGHLKPLGNQRPPTVEIDVFTPETAPTPQKFYENYVKPSKAAIFRNAITETPAFKIWTDEYLKKHYGDLEVRLEGKIENVDNTPIGEKYIGRDTIRHFVDTYRSPESDSYIISELPKQMYHEVGVLPSLGACGDMTKSFVEIDLWWSGGGSKSIIHKDAFNQINCLYRGTKYWKLFEYKYEKWLYKHPEREGEIGGFSDINAEAVDLLQHPNILKVPWSNFTINAGDCLFLPKSYYHQVDSDGPVNLAVSILFRRFDSAPPTNFLDCNSNTEYIIPRLLSDMQVMWVWVGKGDMTMGRADFEEGYRLTLLREAQRKNSKGLNFTLTGFRSMFPNGESGGTSFSEAFNILDSNGNGFLSENEISDATFDQLRALGELVEYQDPSGTYEFEYSLLTYASVKRVLQSALASSDVLTKEKWVEIYQKQLSGTRPFAEEIFNELVVSNTTTSLATKDITSADIERSLTNWVKYYAPQYAFDDDNGDYYKDDSEKDMEDIEQNMTENQEVMDDDLHYVLDDEKAQDVYQPSNDKKENKEAEVKTNDEL